MSSHLWPAPAKLNLMLHITGQREDGYHLLQTVFQFIDFNDLLDFSIRDDGIISRQSDWDGVMEADDLIFRAAKALQQESGCQFGADINLEKKMPAGAGLGGGSSDAATTLVALNYLWELEYTVDKLAKIGEGAYSRLKFESGAHRVQRVPETESQGRIHTSACTVAVMPEIADVGEAEINPADLRIDTFRASGAGGQHVNKTDSAIRLTHLPTGVVVECQDERSQHKNKARALSLLQARLTDAAREKQTSEQAADRKSLVGSGDRSERIRTYNFPQGRITDHRINLTLYKLDEFIEGEIDMIIDPLISENQADQLATLAD